MVAQVVVPCLEKAGHMEGKVPGSSPNVRTVYYIVIKVFNYKKIEIKIF